METIILEFARLLRNAGVLVATQEIEDCIRLLQTTDMNTFGKYDLYRLMNTTMIKAPWGDDLAAWLIELYIEPDVEILQDRFGMFSRGEGGEKRGGAPSEDRLLEAVLAGDVAFLFSSIKKSRFVLDISIENEDALESIRQQSGLMNIAKKLTELYRNGQLTETEFASAQAVMAEWDDFLKDETDHLTERNMTRTQLLKKLDRYNPRRASFLECGDEVLADMSREIQKIAKKMPVRLGRRRRSSKKGDLSLRNTVRQALRTGGVPIKLARTQRKPTKPDLWLICDMSNSVKKFIYFILMFAYCAQERYGSIRTFLFVDSIKEATEHFRNQDWENALNSLHSIRGYNKTGYSQYGLTLRQFAEEFLPQLDGKTTVFILGDAKNNASSLTGVDVVAWIKDQAAAVYWLNPYPIALWGKDDSIMEQYRPHCTGVFQCANIEDLERFTASV